MTLQPVKKKKNPMRALKSQVTRMQDEFFGGGVKSKMKKKQKTSKTPDKTPVIVKSKREPGKGKFKTIIRTTITKKKK